jgi:hypothetical protein
MGWDSQDRHGAGSGSPGRTSFSRGSGDAPGERLGWRDGSVRDGKGSVFHVDHYDRLAGSDQDPGDAEKMTPVRSIGSG